MGGCCCSHSRRRAALSAAPVYYYCPQNLEEHNSLLSRHGGESGISVGLLVDRNLEISIPDVYRPPPEPLPYDVNLVTQHQIPSENLENNVKNAGITRDSVFECGLENLLAFEDAETDEKGKIVSEVDIIESGIEPSKSTESAVVGIYEEDVCPICLEEYVFENPRTITKCEHHFHLACILEWMERSDSCPICDQVCFLSPLFLYLYVYSVFHYLTDDKELISLLVNLNHGP